MMMKGPMREILPLGQQRVQIPVPAGKQIKSLKLLRSGETPTVTESVGDITMMVPSILDFEVIAIDW
jgi:hypothetical protein